MRLFLLFSLVVILPATHARGQAFVMGLGCSEIHCTLSESEDVGFVPPLSSSVNLLFEETGAGLTSGTSVGCTTNGSTTTGTPVIACEYSNNPAGGVPPVVYVYTPSITSGWTSWNTSTYCPGKYCLGAGQCNAPIVGVDGSVVTADYNHIISYSVNGGVQWITDLPYAGVVSVNNKKGNYLCGSIKQFPDGNLVVSTVNGPFALFTSSGALIAPTGCNPTNGACATWAGIASSPGVAPSLNNFWGSEKEGGGINGTTMYKVAEWTDSSSCNPKCGVMMALGETKIGMKLRYTSPAYAAPSECSPMVYTSGSSVYIFADENSVLSPPGINASMVVWQDTNTSLKAVKGFPLPAAMITRIGTPQPISSWSSTGSSPHFTATFMLADGANFAPGDDAYVKKSSVAAANKNWPVAGAVGNAVTVGTGSVNLGSCSSSCGTALSNTAGPWHAAQSWDPVGKCAVFYLTGVPGFHCVNLNAEVVYHVGGTANFVPNEPGGCTSSSDRPLIQAGSDTVMLTGLNCFAVAGQPNTGGAYAALIDTTAGSLVWSYQIAASSSGPGGNNIAGQLSVTEVNNQPIVAFGTNNAGMMALTAPQ